MLGHDFNSWGVETRRGSIPPLRRLAFGPRLWQVTRRVPVPARGHLIMDPTLPCPTSKLDERMVSAALRMWAARALVSISLGSFVHVRNVIRDSARAGRLLGLVA